ncbi:MAG: SDR family oxidoreductase [Verrucomicrobia bacterium]|nr:MAG: SDR family oxidoreductase [Verrucomicrobiota bacterium]
MERLWITGAGGLIGNYFVQAAREGALASSLIGLTRAELDLLDHAAVQKRFRREKPQLVIHCAAMSKSPSCQANPGLARKVNVEVTRQLAELAADAAFVFFSTDLVFDGRKGNYAETDSPNPLSVYAETKAMAEQVVAKHPRHLIIRTSLNGGTSPTGDRGFNEDLRRAWSEGRTLTLFTDEYRSPIHARETVRSVWELIARGAMGVYHVAGSERLSRWQIGELLAERWPQLNPKIKSDSLKNYSGPPRAPDTSLDCSKAQKLLSCPLPGLTDWLAKNPNEPF